MTSQENMEICTCFQTVRELPDSSLMALKEKADCAKAELLLGTVQFPLEADLEALLI